MRDRLRGGLLTLACGVAGAAATVLPTRVEAADPVPSLPMRSLQPTGVKLSRDIRLRIATGPATGSTLPMPNGAPVRKVGGALIDVFPFDDHFHLSAGGKLLNRGVPRADDPESLRTMPAGRAGRRFSPAMLMGYSRGGTTGMGVGVDAGVLVGRSDAPPEQRLRGSEATRPAKGLNGVARMTMRYRF